MEIASGGFAEEWKRRRAALIHEWPLGRRTVYEEEERKRGFVPEASCLPRPILGHLRSGGKIRGSRRNASMEDATEPSMYSRFAALATGSQAAVVKLASFGGGERLAAMIDYVSRNGKVPVENERGEQIQGRTELSSVSVEWSHLMEKRSASRDIGTFQVEVSEGFDPTVDPFDQARALLIAGLGDRRFAFALSSQIDATSYQIKGVAVLRDSLGERLTADLKASRIVETRINNEGQGVAATFHFVDHGNGTDYGTSRLRALVDRNQGVVQDDQGDVISTAKQAADLVQRRWRHELHSRKPRDVIHLVMSARAGTDVGAFRSAARDFLAQEFAAHRYVFSVHDPSQDPKPQVQGGKRPHIHVHAIIAACNEDGDRVQTTISSFRCWRVTMAEKARSHGIDMEMTDRRDRASAPAFRAGQVRPADRVGRTLHVGTSPAGQRRLDDKRLDRPSFARTTKSRDYAGAARNEWYRLAQDFQNASLQAFAIDQAGRFEPSVSDRLSQSIQVWHRQNVRSQLSANLIGLMEAVSENKFMRHMIRKEFEAYEQRVDLALSRAGRLVSRDDMAGFQEIASAAREHVKVRRELMELEERGGQAGRDDVRTFDEKTREHHFYWQDAVARHGLRTVEAANQVMLEVERCRDAIERTGAAEIDTDKAALQRALKREIGKAAALGASGNRLIREIAEVDRELQTAIEHAMRLRADHGTCSHPESAPVGDGDYTAREKQSINRSAEHKEDRTSAYTPRGGRNRSTPPEKGITHPSSTEHGPRQDERDQVREEGKRQERDDRG